jgi:hypothetical protein
LGATVSDLRKTSSSGYSFLVQSTGDKEEIFVQIEADKIPDLAGNKNEKASNELKIAVNVVEKKRTQRLSRIFNRFIKFTSLSDEYRK